MTNDFIPISLFIVLVGGGFITGVLISSAIYEQKLKEAEKILTKLLKDIKND